MRRLAYICASAAALLCAGCWTITPPAKATLKDPVPVFVADYGEHSSVLLMQSPGVYVEYSFGDWAYAVNNYDSIFNALAALTISFQGAYGRTFTPMEPGDPVPRTVRTPTSITRIDVEREKLAKVCAEMDARYQRGRYAPVYNSQNQAFFVRDNMHYSLLDNCNDMTGRILRKLGCETHGICTSAMFTVEEQK